MAKVLFSTTPVTATSRRWRTRSPEGRGATVDVKPIAGDGPGNRLRRLRISNSTRRRRPAGAEAADAAHAIGRSADQLHLPGRQTIDLSDHLPASLIDRALRIGVAV